MDPQRPDTSTSSQVYELGEGLSPRQVGGRVTERDAGDHKSDQQVFLQRDVPDDETAEQNVYELGERLSSRQGSIRPTERDAGDHKSDQQAFLQSDIEVPGNEAPKHNAYERAPPSRWDRLDDWWLWELLSVLVSISSLIALIVTLRTYEGQPLPEWPLGITLNALVAVLSTIMEGSMLVAVAACISQLKWLRFRRPNALKDFDSFDMASRGPWGSLLLLGRMCFRGLATIGALITVLAIAMGPFLQQIISFPLHPDSSGGRASIRRAQIYDEGDDYVQLGGGVQSGPSLQTKAAVYRGIFTDKVPPLDPSCSSGNCTFPLFDTLAMCSKCLNVTDETTRSGERPETTRAYWNLTLTYTLPGDAEIGFIAEYFNSSRQASLRYGPSLVSRTNVSASMSEDTLNISNPLLSFAILQFPGIDRDGYGADYLRETPIAHECALYFCVQTYNLTVTDGHPTTEVVSTWYNKTDPVLEAGFNNHKFLLRPVDQPTPKATEPEDDAFFIPAATFDTILWYLDKTLNGTALARTALVSGEDRTVNDVLEALKVTEDVPALIGNLATSLTNRIREMYVDEGDSDVAGVSLVLVPRVHIEWAWISLPALLVALSCVFLVATAVKTRRSSVPPWKNSSLAVLFHGLGHDPGEDESPTCRERISQMNREGEERRVALGRDGLREWKLQDST